MNKEELEAFARKTAKSLKTEEDLTDFRRMLTKLTVDAETRLNSYEVLVDGIACPVCSYGIEKQLGMLGGILDMSSDIGAGVIRITVNEGVILNEDDVRTAVEKAGFSLRGFTPVER